MKDTYELIEEYAGGILIKRTINGHTIPTLDIERCQGFTMVKMMPRVEVEKMYGKRFTK